MSVQAGYRRGLGKEGQADSRVSKSPERWLSENRPQDDDVYEGGPGAGQKAGP